MSVRRRVPSDVRNVTDPKGRELEGRDTGDRGVPGQVSDTDSWRYDEGRCGAGKLALAPDLLSGFRSWRPG
jgi:hypothetical protein